MLNKEETITYLPCSTKVCSRKTWFIRSTLFHFFHIIFNDVTSAPRHPNHWQLDCIFVNTIFRPTKTKHQNSALHALCEENQCWVDFPHKRLANIYIARPHHGADWRTPFRSYIATFDGNHQFVDCWCYIVPYLWSGTQIARFMGPTWGPDWPHVGPMNLAIRATL